ncbi:CueP family metal-binding protein [Erysipelothrix urinaevulpis]|uniref:CueP family metal-binding protein n=1 Tax=Erysipelothrix urinaevulpis TaxID=2683717 RepID=UPI001356846E|nr:CueP family metal-binding protein [Erysipelothrix urinaevulpis]
MKKYLVVALLAGLILTLFAVNKTNKQDNIAAFLENLNIQYSSNEALIKYLEYDNKTDDSLQAQIYPDKLILSDQKTEVETSLKDSQFYLSFAPFINETHPCTFHVPTGCQGEMPNQQFFVTIRNLKTNELIYNDLVTTADNGFAGLWLPRNIEASIEVMASGLSSKQTISTYNDDPTCLTTLNLI